MTIRKNKKTICIIDDEHTIREMYKIKLESRGFKVVTAKDGEEGYQIIQKEKPDLAMVDIIMPEKDGFYLLEKLQQDQNLNKIPTVTLTNLEDEESKQKAYNLGTLYYFVKADFIPSDVAQIAERVINNHPVK